MGLGKHDGSSVSEQRLGWLGGREAGPLLPHTSLPARGLRNQLLFPREMVGRETRARLACPGVARGRSPREGDT